MIVIIVLLIILVVYQLQHNDKQYQYAKIIRSKYNDERDLDDVSFHDGIVINNYTQQIDEVREIHNKHLRKVSFLRNSKEHTSKGVTDRSDLSSFSRRLRPVYAHHYAKFVDPNLTLSATSPASNDFYQEELINVPLLGLCNEDANCTFNLECQSGVCRHPINPNYCPVRTSIDTSQDKTGLTGTVTQMTGLCSEGNTCINNVDGVGGICAALSGQPCVVSSNCASGPCQTNIAVIFTRNAKNSSWKQETLAPDFFDKIVSNPVNPYREDMSQQQQIASANSSSLQNDILWGLLKDDNGTKVATGVYRRESNDKWRRLLPETIVETMPSQINNKNILVETSKITDINVTREGQPVFAVQITVKYPSNNSQEEHIDMRDALFTLLSSDNYNDAGSQFTELDFEYHLTTSNRGKNVAQEDVFPANIRNLEINPYGDILIIADVVNKNGNLIEEGVLLVKAATSSIFMRTTQARQEVILARFYSGAGKTEFQMNNIGYVTNSDPGIVQFFGVAEGQIYPQFTVQGKDNHPEMIIDFFAEPVADHLDLRKMGSPTLHMLLDDGYNKRISSVFNGVETTLPGYFGNQSRLHISYTGSFYVQAAGTCA